MALDRGGAQEAWLYGGPLHGEHRAMPDPRAVGLTVAPAEWPTGKRVPHLTYVRVPRGPRYDPPPGYEPFVYEDWLVEDRVERVTRS